MTTKFTLTCESTVDIPFDHMKNRNIDVLFYNVLIDGKQHEDDMCRTPNHMDEFFKTLLGDHEVSTCQINEFEYIEFFEKKLAETKGDILHICLGTGMTQSYNNALSALEDIEKKYPDRKIYLVDSLCSCAGYGILVDKAADLRDEGKSAEEVYNWCMANRNKVRHEFYSTDLTFFKKSGRVSGPTATIATILNICPIMHLDAEGKIISYDKVRGEKKAIERNLSRMKKYADKGTSYDGKCVICHAAAEESAEKLREAILTEFKNLKEVELYPIGDVISAHTGPGTVALFFFGEERK